MPTGDGSLVVAAPLSLSGRYAPMGTMAAAGLCQAVEDVAHSGGLAVGGRQLVPEVAVLDDTSTRAGVLAALDLLARADVLVGPYGSDLVAVAARWAQGQGRLVWNHGASADDAQRQSGVVSVPSPATTYLATVLESVADRIGGAEVTVAVGKGAFGQAAAQGAADAAAALGLGAVHVRSHAEVLDGSDVDVLLLAGSFNDDVALLRQLGRRPAIVATVAAGLSQFAAAVAPDGVLAPSQWEEAARFHPDTGPRAAEVVRSLRARLTPLLAARPGPVHVDYPAAQAYATVLVAMRCITDTGSLDDESLETAARRLRCTTFFGRFGLGEDGRQADHQMVVTQWRRGSRWLVWPPSIAEVALSV